MDEEILGIDGATWKPRSRLRWYQYSLRTLFVVMLLTALGMSWVAVKLKQAREQRDAVEAIVRLGGLVAYDYEVDALDIPIEPPPDVPGPAWLRSLVGDDCFRNVVDVWLSNANATDAEMERLAGFNQLRRLSVASNQVTDVGLGYLKGMHQLRSLGIGCPKVTDAGLASLSDLRQLEELSLNKVGITSTGLAHLKALNQLTVLCLVKTDVSDAGLEHIKTLENLKTLDLRGTKVSDAGLHHLMGLKALGNLYLFETKVTDVGVETLQRALPTLKISREMCVPDP